MAGRWQLSVWVLAGLVLSVVALWDGATVSAVADRATERTETVDGSNRPHTDGLNPSDSALSRLDGSSPMDGGSNVLRPTTTTTTRPTTTTTSTSVPSDPPTSVEAVVGTGAGEQAPGSATIIAAGGENDRPGAPPAGSTSTTPQRSPSTVAGDPAVTGVFHTDFADGSLTDGRWSVADSVGRNGWGLLRPSSVTVVADPSAAGGHVLAITARMGSGAESGQVVSGAVRLLGHGLSQGRYTIRARVDPDPAGATSGAILLVPVASTGAPDSETAEIRLMDTGRNRASRSPVESTVRWSDSGATASIAKAHRNADGPVSASEWHVYTLDWTADRVVVSLDGEPLTLTADPARVPPGPMDLAIRLDAVDTPSAPGQQPTLSGEIRLLIDWIRIEAFAGESPR